MTRLTDLPPHPLALDHHRALFFKLNPRRPPAPKFPAGRDKAPIASDQARLAFFLIRLNKPTIPPAPRNLGFEYIERQRQIKCIDGNCLQRCTPMTTNLRSPMRNRPDRLFAVNRR